MSKDHPEIRFDAIIGQGYPFRIAQRVTLAEVQALAARMGRRVAWQGMHMIGTATAEVTLTK